MNPVTIGPIQIAKAGWLDSLCVQLVGAVLMVGIWWLWVWAFKLDGVPTWSYWFAALIGSKSPNYYIRKAR